MTLEELEALFEKHNEEYIEFERIPAERRLSNRPDLNAFLLLDRLFPDTDDIISAAEHDEYSVSIAPSALCEKVSEECLIDLIRCGLRYDSSTDSLCFFV